MRRCLDAEDTEGEVLAPPSAPPAGSGYLSLRLAPDAHSTSAQALIRKHRGIVVYSGGVGVAAMELWRGAVAGLLLPPAMETPWDCAPVVGISNRLGIERWVVAKDGVVPDPSGVDAQLTERTAELLLAP